MLCSTQESACSRPRSAHLHNHRRLAPAYTLFLAKSSAFQWAITTLANNTASTGANHVAVTPSPRRLSGSVVQLAGGAVLVTLIWEVAVIFWTLFRVLFYLS